MFLLPYQGSSLARSVPYATALIVLACTFVYFGLQSKDAARDAGALAYYHDSGLEAVEIPRYQAFLADRNDGQAAERLHALQALAPGDPAAALQLQGDARYLELLHGGHIVRPDEPAYESWRAARAHFDELIGGSIHARFALDRSGLAEPWRLVSYAFLHAGWVHWLGNMVVLLLVAPFVEAALGRLRFALAYLGGAVGAGAAHLAFSGAPVVGSSGAIAACVAMLTLHYGMRPVTVFYWAAVSGTARIPALLLLLPAWLLNEACQWLQQTRHPLPGMPIDFAAHVGGLVAGVALGLTLHPKRAPESPDAAADAARPGRAGATADSTLLVEAQAAAARLDIQRATRLYREYHDLHRKQTDHLSAYLNVAVLGADQEAIQDAAMRLLWAKHTKPTDEVRKTFLLLTQPKVLAALPIDEHLRLARRLVKYREDAAALRIIDAVLRDDHLRRLYGRQLADCLLGIYTAYSRHGLGGQAEQISNRLSTYFPTTDQIGGVAPATRQSTTALSGMPNTVVPTVVNTGNMGNTVQPYTQGPRPAPRLPKGFLD